MEEVWKISHVTKMNEKWFAAVYKSEAGNPSYMRMHTSFLEGCKDGLTYEELRKVLHDEFDVDIPITPDELMFYMKNSNRDIFLGLAESGYEKYAKSLETYSKDELIKELHGLNGDFEETNYSEPYLEIFVKRALPYIEKVVGNHPNQAVRDELEKLKKYAEKNREKEKKKDKGIDL